MYRLVIKIIFFVILILFSETALYLTLPTNTYSFWKTNIEKIKRLKETPSPKLALIGGSNIAFGIDSELIQKELGINVVNMGLSAGFGLKYMINQVEPHLNSQDTVVIIPEYEHFFSDLYKGGLPLAQLILDDKNAKSYLSIIHIPRLIEYLSLTIRNRFNRVLKYYSGISGEPLFSEIKEPIYYRRSFNQNGDVVGHLWQSEREIRNDTSIEKESIDKNGDIIINKKVINILNNFEKFSRSRNIKIFMAPPTLRKSLYANYSPMLDRLFDHISRRCHIPVIAKPKDYVFPDHLLFDTSYHLNAEGREQRTKTLISALQQAGLSKTHPYQEINGSSIHEHQILAADQPVVEIDWLHLFEEVPPQATRSPTPITGRVLGASIADVLHIAIAVNGTIKTTTQTYRHGNSTRFAAIIPKDALKAGRNQVDLYTIHRASQELVALTLCTKAAPSPRTASLISHDDDTEVISHLDGTTTFVERGEVAGKINRAKTTDEGLNFIGWAVNAKAQELPEAIMVFVDGDFFYSTQTTHERPDVELTYDNPSLRWSGFNFTLPITFLKASNKPYIRVFALLQNGLAAELQYADPYPWGPKPIRNADRY